MTESSFKNNLKVELAKSGKNQKWLAGEMNWSSKHTSQVCNGKAGTTPENWLKIAGLLNTTVEALLGDNS